MSIESGHEEFVRQLGHAIPDLSTLLSNDIVKRVLAHNQGGTPHSLSTIITDLDTQKNTYPALADKIQSIADMFEEASFHREKRGKSVEGLTELLKNVDYVIVRELLTDIFIAAIFDNPAKKNIPPASIGDMYAAVFSAIPDENGRPLTNETIRTVSMRQVIGALLLGKIALPLPVHDRNKWWRHRK